MPGDMDVGVNGAFIATEANMEMLDRARPKTILGVLEAHDAMLCRVVLRAVANGASEVEWLQVMRDTRALLSSQFFNHVQHVEAQGQGQTDGRGDGP